jgi:hypothetical protein
LKNGGPNLVDALHAVIQQAWTGETVSRSWTEGYCVKKGDKLDCKNYRGICLLNVTQSLRQNSIGEALEGEAAKVGLKINEEMTKYMIVARNDRTIRGVGQSVTIGDKHFEVVKEFEKTPTIDVRLEIQRRIQTANRCFLRLRKHMRSSHLSRQTKFTIHKTLIRPVLLCGSETWVLTKREENQSYLRKRFSERYAAQKSQMVL